MTEVNSQLEQLVLEHLSFLQTAKSFTRKPLIKHDGLITHIIYRHQVIDLGIDFELDSLDDVLAIHLMKLERGNPPTYLSANGKKFVDYSNPSFERVLREQLLLSDPLIDSIYKLNRVPYKERDIQYKTEYIEQSHMLLAKYIDLILRQPLTVLFDNYK